MEKKAVAERIIVLAQEYGILLGKAEERISLGEASPAVAQMLGIAAGSPVMVLDRVVMALDGRPDRMAGRALPSGRQVLHGRDGLSRASIRAGRAAEHVAFAIRASWSSMSPVR